jgi:hypothetical protein
MTNFVTFLPSFNPVQWVMQADAAGLIKYFNPAGKLTPHIATQHDCDRMMRLVRLADATPRPQGREQNPYCGRAWRHGLSKPTILPPSAPAADALEFLLEIVVDLPHRFIG